MSIAQAHSNIALIKYWGKRHQALKLPQHGSISLTLDGLYTRTEVTYPAGQAHDELWLNEQPASPAQSARAAGFMDLLRQQYGFRDYARIVSYNAFPTGAGLASSASGFAALALAATAARGFSLTEMELSILARQGSGSACRSVAGGFVEWLRGEKADGSDSYAVQLLPESGWDLRMLVLVLQPGPKAISSGEGMERTVRTSPLYGGWLGSLEEDLAGMRAAIASRDFTAAGALMEHNCLKMHATAWSARPAVSYWLPQTLALIQCVWQLRAEGLECYFTIDAGPNVKVLVQADQAGLLHQALSALKFVQEILVCQPGPGAFLLPDP